MLPLFNSFMKRTSGSVQVLSSPQPSPTIECLKPEIVKELSTTNCFEISKNSSLNESNIKTIKDNFTKSNISELSDGNGIVPNVNDSDKSKKPDNKTKRGGFLICGLKLLQALRIGNSSVASKDQIDSQVSNSLKTFNEQTLSSATTAKQSNAIDQPQTINPLGPLFEYQLSVHKKAQQQFDNLLLSPELLNASSSSLSSSSSSSNFSSECDCPSTSKSTVKRSYRNHKPISFHCRPAFERTSSTSHLHKTVDRYNFNRRTQSAVDFVSKQRSSLPCDDYCNSIQARKTASSTLKAQLRSKILPSPKQVHCGQSQFQLSLQASNDIYGPTTTTTTTTATTTSTVTASHQQSHGLLLNHPEPRTSCLRAVCSAVDHIRHVHSQISPQLNSFSETDQTEKDHYQEQQVAFDRQFIKSSSSYLPNQYQSQSIKSNQHIRQLSCSQHLIASFDTRLPRSLSCPCIQRFSKKMATEPPVYEQQQQPLLNPKQIHSSFGEQSNVSSTRPLSATSSPSSCGLPKLSFNCQLAHGSPVHSLSGFSTMLELYRKISEEFTISVDEILYCTLNTHKVEMDKLLGGQIGVNDMIFVHCKGRAKEIEIQKSDELLGLTITDNGNGICFIKKIKENSVIDKIRFISVGDHIEKINDRNLVGCRHFEVTKALKEIELGKTFVMRVVEPRADGFGMLSPRSRNNTRLPGSDSVGFGRDTLRIRSSRASTSTVSLDLKESSVDHLALERINLILEQFMGIADDELALSIWEAGQKRRNPHEFLLELHEGELAMFEFGEDMIFDLWGAVHDTLVAKSN